MAGFDEVYSALLDEFQLAGAVDCTIGKLLAEEMIRDQPDADRILRLKGALTAKQSSAGADLSKLDDAELAFLDRVRRKLFGEAADVALSPEQRAEIAEVDRQREALDQEQREREEGLRADRARLEAQVHELLIRLDEMTRQAPSTAAQ